MDSVEKYIEDHDVVFKMTAVIDGEEQITFTGTSFDDVSSYAALADEAFEKYIVEADEHSADSLVDDAVNERSY